MASIQPEAAPTVTVVRSIGPHGWSSPRSTRHQPDPGGAPTVDMSTRPTSHPPSRRTASCTARPTVDAVEGQPTSAPGPSVPPRPAAPGPRTTTSGTTADVVVCTPRRLKAGAVTAPTAASTTPNAAGGQPHITHSAARSPRVGGVAARTTGPPL